MVLCALCNGIFLKTIGTLKEPIRERWFENCEEYKIDPPYCVQQRHALYIISLRNCHLMTSNDSDTAHTGQKTRPHTLSENSFYTQSQFH